MACTEFTLSFDQAGVDLLEFQEYDLRRFRGYYLLRGNPAVRVITQGGFIEDALSYILPVLVERGRPPVHRITKRETLSPYGVWVMGSGNPPHHTSHITASAIVTVLVGDVRDVPDAERFSVWLRRHYLSTEVER